MPGACWAELLRATALKSQVHMSDGHSISLLCGQVKLGMPQADVRQRSAASWGLSHLVAAADICRLYALCIFAVCRGPCRVHQELCQRMCILHCRVYQGPWVGQGMMDSRFGVLCGASALACVSIVAMRQLRKRCSGVRVLSYSLSLCAVANPCWLACSGSLVGIQVFVVVPRAAGLTH